VYLPEGSSWANYEDSKEVYLKIKAGDFQFSARHMDLVNQRPGGSSHNTAAYSTREHNYIDLKYTASWHKHWELEGRVFADWIDRVEKKASPSLVRGLTFKEKSEASEEKAWGLELLGRWDAGTGHSVLLGFSGVQTDISDVTNQAIHPVTANSPVLPVYTLKASPDNNDTNLALFAEDNWQINERFNITLGLRIDKNDLREDSTIVLPRFAANWKIDNAWALQYAYSTGYLRPPAAIGFLGEPQDLGFKAYGAEDSQEVLSHDLRLSYNQKPLSVTLNFYHTTIENPFNIFLEPNSDFSEWLFYVNTADVETMGSELEFNYVPSTRWNIYGNLSYVAKAEIKSLKGESFGIDFDLNNSFFGFSEGAYTGDGTVVGYPHKMFNLGANYFFTESLSANLHYRWWSDMVSRDRVGPALTLTENAYHFGPEYFVDLNLRYTSIGDTGLDVSLFVKNLLDREAELTTLYYTSVWFAKGRSVGAKLSYRF
jgi:outer membrane receptor protein involved in Fe transport